MIFEYGPYSKMVLQNGPIFEYGRYSDLGDALANASARKQPILHTTRRQCAPPHPAAPASHPGPTPRAQRPDHPSTRCARRTADRARQTPHSLNGPEQNKTTPRQSAESRENTPHREPASATCTHPSRKRPTPDGDPQNTMPLSNKFIPVSGQPLLSSPPNATGSKSVSRRTTATLVTPEFRSWPSTVPPGIWWISKVIL